MANRTRAQLGPHAAEVNPAGDMTFYEKTSAKFSILCACGKRQPLGGCADRCKLLKY